jgi:hypothetical protein
VTRKSSYSSRWPVYGVPGAHAPALHPRTLGAGDLFATYAKSFTDVWALSKPATW